MKTAMKNAKSFKVPATDENLKWVSENLVDADWDLKENTVDIIIYYDYDSQMKDILTELDKLR